MEGSLTPQCTGVHSKPGVPCTLSEATDSARLDSVLRPHFPSSSLAPWPGLILWIRCRAVCAASWVLPANLCPQVCCLSQPCTAQSSHEGEAAVARHTEAKPQPRVLFPNMFSFSLPKLSQVAPALGHRFWWVPVSSKCLFLAAGLRRQTTKTGFHLGRGLGRAHELTVPAPPCFPFLDAFFCISLFSVSSPSSLSSFLLPSVSFPASDLGPQGACFLSESLQMPGAQTVLPLGYPGDVGQTWLLVLFWGESPGFLTG